MTTFKISKLGLAALAVLLTGTATSQLKQNQIYHVTVLGPANANHIPSLGIDTLGRVAGYRLYDEVGNENTRGWLFDVTRGYRVAVPETSAIHAVSANGDLVGSHFGSPTFFDWNGNAVTVFTANAGAFMAVNRNRQAAGYIYDPLNNWTQTAVVFDANGVMVQIPSLDMTTSAAYGINDSGVVVGVAGNAVGEARAF